MAEPPAKQPAVPRLVLKHKRTSKIASRPDQAERAIQIEAQHLHEAGLGGGIVTPLLPSTGLVRAKNLAIQEIYDVIRVKSRETRVGEASDRVGAMDGVKTDELMFRLVDAWAMSIGPEPRPHAITAIAFARWVRATIRQRQSPANLAAKKLAPSLIAIQRSERWWVNAFGAWKKMQS